MSIKRHELTGIHILVIVMLILSLGGGFHRLITMGLRGHQKDSLLGTDTAASQIRSYIAYQLRPLSDYELVISKDLFQPLHSRSQNVSNPKPAAEKPIAKIVAETEPIKDRKLNIGIVVTGIVRDNQRTLVLVEDTKSRECKFVALGESVSGSKLIEIEPGGAVFDVEGRRVKIALGGLRDRGRIPSASNFELAKLEGVR